MSVVRGPLSVVRYPLSGAAGNWRGHFPHRLETWVSHGRYTMNTVDPTENGQRKTDNVFQATSDDQQATGDKKKRIR